MTDTVEYVRGERRHDHAEQALGVDHDPAVVAVGVEPPEDPQALHHQLLVATADGLLLLRADSSLTCGLARRISIRVQLIEGLDLPVKLVCLE